jgi:hypothetical protein
MVLVHLSLERRKFHQLLHAHLPPLSQAGYVTEDDIRTCSVPEKNAIDFIIDAGPQTGEASFICVLLQPGAYFRGWPWTS